MTPKYILSQSMSRAMRKLKKDGQINSPVFHVKSKRQEQPEIVYDPLFENPNETKAVIALKMRLICNQVDAKEVLTIADTLIPSMEDEAHPPQDALLAMLERGDKIFNVIQPYKKDRAGKIWFDKKRWTTRDKTGRMGTFEGFVKP